MSRITDEVRTAWDRVAADLAAPIAESGTWNQVHDINPVALRLLGDLDGKRILDLACGTGQFSRLMAQRAETVLGIDISERMVRLARELSGDFPNLSYQCCDAEDLQAGDASYDAIVCNMGIHNIANADRAISAAAEQLEDCGSFVIVSPHPFAAHSPWLAHDVDGLRRFGRFVFRYLSPTQVTEVLSLGKGKPVPQFHRSLSYYFDSFFNAGLRVTDFVEFCTTKPILRTRDEELAASTRSVFLDADDRAIKEEASRELPTFMALKAVRSK